MKKLYKFDTDVGTFFISEHKGRFHIHLDEEHVDHFHRPDVAAHDLSNGHSGWPSTGDPSLLGIPDELEEWDKLF